ncbi:putative DNA repair protein recA homolog 4 [Arachis stenosperma]|uniref:putative DNA repair protein recA homolog 4 n=1 Tax=Arachis stenosperma TaxID=217475 RepID=UPI0025AB71AF|nr:putative DNA repair protein recA homolog 4 [Arachis stenosperma]
MLPSGYLIRPCEGGGSIIHIVDHLNLEVAALVPKGELDDEMGDAHMAMQARLMSQALRKLSHSLSVSPMYIDFYKLDFGKPGTCQGCEEQACPSI